MVNSMTGFGVGSAEGENWRVEVSIRSLNNRFLSTRIRSLNDHPQLLSRIETRLKETFSRGEISVWIGVNHVGTGGNDNPLDVAAAQSTYRELLNIQQLLGIKESPSLEDLSRAGGLQPLHAEDERLWLILEQALAAAIMETNAGRAREGDEMKTELAAITDRIRDLLEQVKERLPVVLDEIRTRLAEKIEALQLKVEPSRMEAEVALLADRFDVQEEIVRLSTHLDRAMQVLEVDKPIGKELDFLSQEMLREVNTLGSKARDTSTSSIVVDMKLAVEQFKEQLQNVE
ncbi:YicC family protein [Candidatus Bipolaricaulota bacterium]|nr:YicC family protein [Candidatus Bipolaricaulota bacterium]